MSTFNDDLSADMRDPAFAAEFERTNRLIQDLRSDLQESADALDESAQLLDDALDENTRLREKAQFFADAWERATRADFEKAQENERLRAELETLYDGNRRALNTISRVRAVLDTADVSDRETGFFQDVRDALNGESE